MERSFATPRRTRLTIRVAAGEVRLRAADTTETTVHLEARNRAGEAALPRARVELIPHGDVDEVLVDVPDPRLSLGDGPEIDASIRCPQGTEVDIRTSSADVRAAGRFAAVRSKTASGDVEVERTDGALSVHTASGNVVVGVGGASVEVRTASGDADIDQVAGPLLVNLVSGDLRIGASESSVEANTVSGDQRLESAGAGPISLHSVSGDLEVRVRPGLDVWIDAGSLSGDTVSELTPSEGPSNGEGAELLEVRMKSVSGEVRLARASELRGPPNGHP